MSELRERSKQWDKQYVGAGTGFELSYDIKLTDEENQTIIDDMEHKTLIDAIEDMFPELGNKTWWPSNHFRTITWQETVKE